MHGLNDDGIDVATNDMGQRNGMNKVVEEVNQKGRRAVLIPGDVSHEPSVVAVVERTAKNKSWRQTDTYRNCFHRLLFNDRTFISGKRGSFFSAFYTGKPHISPERYELESRKT